MDKAWISLNRNVPEYFEGAQKFLDFAFKGLGSGAKTKCPCRKCYLRYSKTRTEMNEHIILNGFVETYTFWDVHGEKKGPVHSQATMGCKDDMVGMVNELLGATPNDGLGEEQPDCGFTLEDGEPMNRNEAMDEETSKFFKMLEAATKPLFKGCKKFTSLSFIIRLLHIKVLGGMTNNCCTLIFKLLSEAFEDLEDLDLPASYNEAKKITDKLGFEYETWDACKSNCMLFRNEEKDLERCRYCQRSRYREPKDGVRDDFIGKRKRVPEKQMRYFPLKPRLKRLFRSSHTASLMTWHSDERVDDGVMRHPADSPAWKNFQQLYPSFASERRNIMFGAAADGFNPYGNMSIAHSTWPVVLVPYNLPPWECMKQHNFILSILVDGPKGPGDKIDVYLQPLVEELKELWFDGIDAYDVYQNERFTLRAALLWTINDFPALGDLMGYGVRGELACPTCEKETRSFRLKHGGKFCYWGHRRWLDENHKFRRDKASFDGKPEWGTKPKALSGSEILEQLNDVETVYKKEDILRKRKREEYEKDNAKEKRAQLRREKQMQKGAENNGRGKGKAKGKSKRKKTEDATNDRIKSGGYKKKSIFFELPYWEHNVIRHNLDVMHIEKNVCDNVLYTLLGVNGKTKDNWKSRLDLQEMNIRKPLHLQHTGTSGRKVMPPACFTMSRQEKEIFLKVLKNVRVPDGYASNISRCVNMEKLSISGLKSHDSHILMQQLLPIALRKALPNKNVVEALIDLSNFFRRLCSKMNKLSDLEYIQDRIALTLCQLEKIFPPSFFDIMEHLPIHLADEAVLAGAVPYRWMYPIERYLCTLKGYVRNQARPEGSIAKGYQMEECMTFCSRYLHDVETKSNRPGRNDSGKDNSGQVFGSKTSFKLDNLTRDQIHRYVLANTECVQPYTKIHLAYLKQRKPKVADRELHRKHSEEFPKWFRDHVVQKTMAKEEVPAEVKDLALGPSVGAEGYNGYLINGFRFRTKDTDHHKVSQNSGVALTATTRSYSSCSDSNPKSGDVTFYGKLTDIIEVLYPGGRKYVMFRCDWIDSRKGLRVDCYKFTSVNFKHLLYKENKATDEPFIFASQAEQVFYVNDPVDKEWQVVVRMTSRDTFDMGIDDDTGLGMEMPQSEPYDIQQFDENQVQEDDDSNWVRHDVEGICVTTREGTSSAQTKSRNHVKDGPGNNVEDDYMLIDEDDIDMDEYEEEETDEDVNDKDDGMDN